MSGQPSGPVPGSGGPGGGAGGPGGLTTVGRPVEILRGAWGALCLLAPQQVAGALAGRAPDHPTLVVTRILGVRHLVQAAFSLRAPGPAVLAAGTWVDVVHALTAAGLAVVKPSYARPALLDGAIASAWALTTRRDVTRADVVLVGGHPVWTERLARAVLPLLPGAPAAPLPDGPAGRR